MLCPSFSPGRWLHFDFVVVSHLMTNRLWLSCIINLYPFNGTRIPVYSSKLFYKLSKMRIYFCFFINFSDNLTALFRLSSSLERARW
jgi:hypothetical protein